MILGAIPGATPDKWAARWRERFPEHALDVQYYDDAGQLARITEGTVDIGYVRFREYQVEVDTEVHHRVLLYREEPVVCAAADHWIAAADESVGSEELVDETFLDPARMLQDWGPTGESLQPGNWPPERQRITRQSSTSRWPAGIWLQQNAWPLRWQPLVLASSYCRTLWRECSAAKMW